MTGNRHVSVVIPTLDEGDNVLDTVDVVLRHVPQHDTEVIVVDDGSRDHSLDRLRALSAQDRIRLIEEPRIGPARCRNRGAAAASGELLVFLDAHCFVPDGWLTPLRQVMDHAPDVGVVGPAIGHTGNFRFCGFGGTWHDDTLEMSWLPPVERLTDVPFQPAGCQMVRRKIFDLVGGYDERMTAWGSEDVEFCVRVWLFGYRVCVKPDTAVLHCFRRHPPYGVNLPQIIYNKLRMIFLHFDGDRLERVLRSQLPYSNVERGLARIYTDGTHRHRERLFQRRRHDMDWFCDRFGLVA